jgi:hypothetical protein
LIYDEQSPLIISLLEEEAKAKEFRGNKYMYEVTTVGYCSAAGMYIPPMLIFKGASILERHKQNFPAMSTVQMAESSYINEAVFVECL